METDAHLRNRTAAEYDRRGLSHNHVSWHYIRTSSGHLLDLVAASLGLNREDQPSADPFGSSLTEALRREDAVIPHSVQPVPAEDHDAMWRSIVEYGRGG